MFVFTPTASVREVGDFGQTLIWTNTNCNCNYVEYNLGSYQLRMSIYQELSVRVNEELPLDKYLGKQTIIFTLATETTLGLTAKMNSPEIGTIVLDPTLYGYTEATIEYVKLA